MVRLKNYLLNRRNFVVKLLTLLAGVALSRSGKAKGKNSCFRHGVASGDPLQDRVIIWTRITSEAVGEHMVYWEVATDKAMLNIVQKGKFVTSIARDFTVKVDVINLTAGHRYYYRFSFGGCYSEIGETQTLPDCLDDKATFNIAVVACNDYEAGYFNAFRYLAEKGDVNMVLHLGDYIYEYGIRSEEEYNRKGGLRKGHGVSIGRIVDPPHEILTLDDYRRRYALYRQDPDLQLLHAKKPFYMVWDDHEIANDAYVGGAANHNTETEGTYEARRHAAIQAYFEWLPVRGNAPRDLIRKFCIGEDIELFLLDERLSGKTKQLKHNDPGFFEANNTMLGEEQYNWLETHLINSRARWKLIANQVPFVGYRPQLDQLPSYEDKWLGYPYERNKLIDALSRHQINGVVILTGDHHRSFVLALHEEDEYMKYQKTCDERPLAWELITPSITSKNDDVKPIDVISETERLLCRRDINPHLLFTDIKRQGYYVVRVGHHSFRADYYFVTNLTTREADEQLSASFLMNDEEFLLKRC